ncbi:protein lplB [Paenibacillus swuensis]|uniref:Protein lplB n=1 Tax=Paenibacillus swuensis TaxID=1178515 RepID=A0A172TPU8_9BACL|nr:ABC transporter permease subunit [Paenibacillus swuensis]ANE49068.1 protein lplB [Paenibacillus swuensis]
MLLPLLILIGIFNIAPMFGIVLAFKTFNPSKGILGSPWAGLAHFQFVIQNPESLIILKNTLIIAAMKISAGLVAPILFALMLNEIRVRWFKRSVQTLVYLPHFLSWVILAGIFRDIFGLEGIINQSLGKLFQMEPIMFLGSNDWFRPILVLTDTWKEFGFGTIIYLAALTSINPALYEAADIDGASRWRKMRHITLPGIATTIVVLATLSLNGVLNAGFDQVFNMYNALVYDTGDIIDTYVYRMGLVSAQYEIATAIGLAKSIVSFILIAITYGLAYRFANYRIF